MPHSSLSAQQRQLAWTPNSAVCSSVCITLSRMVSFPSHDVRVLVLINLPAGLPLSKVAGSRTAVYVGSSAHDYDMILTKDPEVDIKYASTGLSPAMLSGRISWFYDLSVIPNICTFHAYTIRVGSSKGIVSGTYVDITYRFPRTVFP